MAYTRSIWLIAALAATVLGGCVRNAKSSAQQVTASSPAPSPAVTLVAPDAPPSSQPAAPAVAAPAPTAPAESDLALVNGSSISAEQFALGYPAYRKALGFPADTPELRGQYLDALVALRLLEQEARRDGLAHDPEFFYRLADSRKSLIQEALLDRKLADGIGVSEGEIEAHYKAHLNEYAQPASAQFLLIASYTQSTAQKARDRIAAGEEFRKVAAEVSIHPSRIEGGALAAFSPGKCPIPELESRILPLKVGELSPVLQTRQGWHVVEKIAEKPEQVRPLSEARDAIRAKIEQRKRATALAELNETLRRQAQVRILRQPAIAHSN